MTYASNRASHDEYPHVTVLARVHELAADADVGAAEEDDTEGEEGPKHEE